MLNTTHDPNPAANTHIATRPLPKRRDVLRSLSQGLMRAPREPSLQRQPALAAHWLVLALVIEQPSHAYEVGARYEQRFGSFAPTATNAVYKALDRLSDDHLVISLAVVPGPGRRTVRLIYKATAAGVEAHQRWLLSGVRQRYWRTELLARIATGTVLGRSELLTLIALYEQMTVTHSQQIDKPPQAVSEKIESADIIIGRLVAQEQEAITSAQLSWAKKARDEIRRIPA